jgi:light-regulated signal transduction histidine kinase (bacteriophytochrome)
MESVQELHSEYAVEPQSNADVHVQPGAYLLELSLDWMVLRASENVHHLVGQSHVTLIDEPLGRFVHSQALHDLRNLFSRLSGTTGIARAYRVRLTDDPDLVDIAFQLSDGRVILEAVATSDEAFGTAFGTVGGLIAGLASSSGQALLDAGARRMRALTGYDRVTLKCGGRGSESSRGAFPNAGEAASDLPVIIADATTPGVSVFPRKSEDTSVESALMRCPERSAVEGLRDQGIHSTMRVPFAYDGGEGEYCCHNRTPRAPNFELHAAAELFAQLFGMRLEIDQLKNS